MTAEPRRRSRHLASFAAAVVIGSLTLAAGGDRSEARAETLGVQVNRAVDRGVAHLLAQQNPDGSFRGVNAHDYPVGVTAFALYALAKSKVPADAVALAKGIEWVRSRPLEKTYEVACAILALDAAKVSGHDEWIRTAARWLEDRLDPKDGLWAYPVGPTRDHSKTDLSNTQFAVLGLWVAEAHGYRSRRETWETLARRVPEHQTPYGAFFYSTNRGDRQGSGSMTTAGLTVLSLALERMGPAERPKPYAGRAAKARERGWEYLDRRLTVASDLDGEHAFRDNGHLYFLYGLERVAAIDSRERIGGRDWYAEGARHLVRIQSPDGSWYGTTEDTSAALLFLRKATATQLGVGPRALDEPAEPSVADPAPRPPSPGVPFLQRWLVLGPFDNPDDAGLGTPFVHEGLAGPTPGARVENRVWTPYRSRGAFVSLRHATGAGDHSLSYAFTWLHASADADVVLWFGHDDGARIVLDGRVVHERHVHEGAHPDRRWVRARLAAGAHRLLVKVEEWDRDSGLFLRLAHEDGSDVAEVVPTWSSSPPTAAEEIRRRPDPVSFEDLLRRLPPDRYPTLDFSRPEDLDRVVIQGAAESWPFWARKSIAARDQPHPKGQGFVSVHPRSPEVPVRVVRRVRLPPGFPLLRVTVSGDPYEAPTPPSDFVLRIGVFDGAWRVLRTETVAAGAPSPDGWRTFDADLRAFAGKDVLLVAEVSAGGAHGWFNEEAFLDEMTVGTSLR